MGPPPAAVGDDDVMSPATAKPPKRIKKTTDGTTRSIPWNTILFNCQCHTFHEVARQLMKAIRVSYDQGMAIANIVDSQGRAVVYTGHRERCEAVAMVLEDIGLIVKVSQ
jgi:ATP-dependent Clp protease adapter protein ClpS